MCRIGSEVSQRLGDCLVYLLYLLLKPSVKMSVTLGLQIQLLFKREEEKVRTLNIKHLLVH